MRAFILEIENSTALLIQTQELLLCLFQIRPVKRTRAACSPSPYQTSFITWPYARTCIIFQLRRFIKEWLLKMLTTEVINPRVQKLFLSMVRNSSTNSRLACSRLSISGVGTIVNEGRRRARSGREKTPPVAHQLFRSSPLHWPRSWNTYWYYGVLLEVFFLAWITAWDFIIYRKVTAIIQRSLKCRGPHETGNKTYQ